MLNEFLVDISAANERAKETFISRVRSEHYYERWASVWFASFNVVLGLCMVMS